jgi:hypothetical protein
MASPRLIPRLTYRATLIGPIGTNKQRSVNFSIDGTCFSIADYAKLPKNEPALITNVAFPYVYKVCKASERAKNKGQPHMLDLVMHTKQGLRDLRLSLGSEQTVRLRFLCLCASPSWLQQAEVLLHVLLSAMPSLTSTPSSAVG